MKSPRNTVTTTTRRPVNHFSLVRIVSVFTASSYPISRSRRGERPMRSRHPTTDPIWKIGRYIAITIKPIVMPRNTISMGSRSEVSAATAESTSSS